MPNIDYIIMVLIALSGVLMVITNKPLFIGTDKYTKESLKKYPRPAGISTILFGGFGWAFLYTLRLFFEEKISGWITLTFLVLTVAAIIANIVITKKILEKK